MNQQHLTKLANALVKKREKRAALWDKLLRAGKLSPDAMRRIFRSISPGDEALTNLFPRTHPASKGLWGPGRISIPRAAHQMEAPVSHVQPGHLDEIIGRLRKAQVPAKSYAPMKDITTSLVVKRLLGK